MRSRLAILLGFLLLLFSDFARAKAGLQGSFALSMGWTDNALNGVSQPAPGQPGRFNDFFAEVRPSLILSSGSARAVQTVSYAFDSLLYFRLTSTDTYSNQLLWSGYFLPSARTQVLVAASLIQGKLNMFNAQILGTTGIAALATGATGYVGPGLNQQFSLEMTEHWRFSQTLAFQSFLPYDSPTLSKNFIVDQNFIFDYSWRRDALGIRARVNYSLFDQVYGRIDNGDGTFLANALISPRRQQIIDELGLRWRHDHGHFWTSELQLGVVQAMRANDGGGQIWQPAGMAAMRYTRPIFNGELSFRHTVQSDAFAGATFAVDQVLLTAALPLGQKSRSSLGVSGSYSHGRLIDLQSGFATSTNHLFVADAGLSTRPVDWLTLMLRYSLVTQLGDSSAAMPLPTVRRDVILLSVSGVYPPAPVATVPSREALRVDRSDQPTIPEPHSKPYVPQE